MWGDRWWGMTFQCFKGDGMLYSLSEACGDGGQAVGQDTSISGSGRRVSWVKGGLRCVGTGGGAEFFKFGNRAACPILI